MSIFSIVHFYFLSSPPGDVVHSLALLTGAEARIRIPASRRTSTRRAFPPPARSAHHVALSLPPSLRPATPPSFAFQNVSGRAHHTSTRFCVPNALRRRSSRLPHPLRTYHVSSGFTARAWPVHVARGCDTFMLASCTQISRLPLHHTSFASVISPAFSSAYRLMSMIPRPCAFQASTLPPLCQALYGYLISGVSP